VRIIAHGKRPVAQYIPIKQVAAIKLVAHGVADLWAIVTNGMEQIRQHARAQALVHGMQIIVYAMAHTSSRQQIAQGSTIRYHQAAQAHMSSCLIAAKVRIIQAIAYHLAMRDIALAQ
jgi:hypothetical protein